MLWELSLITSTDYFQVEGILQNTESGVDVEKIGNFEVPSLNTFDKPLAIFDNI